MTIKDLARAVRERWRVVVAATLVGVVAAALFASLRPVEYTSRVTFYVAAENSDTANAAYQGTLLSEKRVKSYTDLVTSTRVTREVARRLQLPVLPADLAEQIKATSLPGAVLIQVEVSDPDGAQAVRLADSVATVFTGVVTDLERPAAPGALPPVSVRVVQAPTVPLAPSSPATWLVLLCGLVGGVAVGAGIAAIRNKLDTSIKSVADLKTATDSPNLGTMIYDSSVDDHPLVLQDASQSVNAEAMRQLRTNLQYVDLDHPRKIIAVTSSLPGEGKTTTVVNLALALASTSRRVVLVEADLRRPRFAELFGIEGQVGVTSVLAGRVTAAEAMQSTVENLDVLTSGPNPPNPSELLASGQMRSLLSALREQYDVVLVDTPPLLPVTDAAAVASSTDGVLFVCRCRRTSRGQVAAALRSLHAVSAPLLGTVLTMVPAQGSQSYGSYGQYRTYRSAKALPTLTPQPRASSTPDVPSQPTGRSRPTSGQPSEDHSVESRMATAGRASTRTSGESS